MTFACSTTTRALAIPGYDEQRGRQLAEAFASAVPQDAFFRVLEQPTSTWEELDELEAFCPCKLHENATEHELLLDLFPSAHRAVPGRRRNDATGLARADARPREPARARCRLRLRGSPARCGLHGRARRRLGVAGHRRAPAGASRLGNVPAQRAALDRRAGALCSGASRHRARRGQEIDRRATRPTSLSDCSRRLVPT